LALAATHVGVDVGVLVLVLVLVDVLVLVLANIDVTSQSVGDREVVSAGSLVP